MMAKSPAWTRKEGKNPEGGLNAKGRASAKAEGMNLKPPQPEGGSRKKSFCARMKGMKAKLTSSETANDPDSRINKSLRKWKCADGGEITANLPIMARQPDVEIENALRAAKNQSSAPYGVIDMGDKIIVGAVHGEPVEVSEDLRNKVQQVSRQHGAWYEGTGGDVEPNKNLIPQYKGSWDEQYAKSVKGYPIEYLSPLFSNVDVNKQYEAFEDPKRSIMDSLIVNQDKAKYFKDRKYDQKTVQEFLRQGSEGDVDFIKLAQQPATKENLQRFFSTGERLMWPENWQEYPHNLGKLAKRLEENRNRFLINAPPGVYITGAGHIPEIKSLKKDIRVIGGEKSSFAYGGEITVENALRLTRKGDKIPLRPYEPRWNESTGKFDSPQNKGIGFAGPLKQRGADHVVSEYSRDEDFQYPTIHSGMSAADRAAVMEAERLSEPKYQGDDIISERLNRAQKPFDIPQDVDRRAHEAAKERIQAGRSPFFEQGRDPYPAWSPEQYWEEPAVMPNRADPLVYADGGDVTVDNALRMARNMGGGTLYNRLNYALNSPTPANPPQDPGPQQPYYQSLPQTREMVQQYGTPAPGAPTSSPVRQPMPYADGGEVEGDVQFAPNDLPMMARQPDVEIENALRMARETQPKKEYAPFSVLPLREDEAGVHFDPYAGLLGTVTRPFKHFTETMSGEKPMDVTSPESIAAATGIAGAVTLGAGAFERPAGALAAGASRPVVAQDVPAYQRLVNPAGFYSRAHEVAMTALPEGPRTWQEMRSLLAKQPGVREEELYWSGLTPRAYDPTHKLTREEIAEKISQGFPQVSPVVKKREHSFPYSSVDEFQEAISRAERSRNWNEVERLQNAWEEFEGGGMLPMHEQYTVPGGQNYSERILTHEYYQGDEGTKAGNAAFEEFVPELRRLDEQAYSPNLSKEERQAARQQHQELYAKATAAAEQASPEYTRGLFQHHAHLGDIDNPILHTRNSERNIPGRGKVWHQEEVQSDWAQQGREKGFRPEPLSPAEKKELDGLLGNVGPDSPPEVKARYQELSNRDASSITQSGIPQAPYVRDTEHWLDLAAKDTLKSAIEGGHDWIFVTGGQEQAKRWSNELKKAVDTIRWNTPNPETQHAEVYAAAAELYKLRNQYSNEMFGRSYDSINEIAQGNVDEMLRQGGRMIEIPEIAPEGSKIVYAKPTGFDTEQRFVVKPVEQPGGKVRYEVIDSSIPRAKGETLAAVVGQDMAKRIMAEESGEQAMKGYRLGSEGYTQTYERKYPSSFKKLIKQLDPQAKIEAGEFTPNPSDKRQIDQIAQRNFARNWDELSAEQQDAMRYQLGDLEASLEPVKGTWIQITPKMRAEYGRLKRQHGAVFPAYRTGGGVKSFHPDVDVSNALRMTRKQLT